MKCCTTNAVSWLKFWRLVVLGAAVMLGNAASAGAGQMHARAVIGLGVSSQFAPHGGVAHAERHQGSKYRVAHEEFGNNYTYGNAGSGHAHHHSGLFSLLPDNEGRNSVDLFPGDAPPVLGEPGTAQYILQTWLPNTAGDEITVAWSPDSFLQVDLSELTPGNPLVSRASLAADGGLVGSVELSAWLNDRLMPEINTQLTGIFDGLAFELVSHPGGIVSLQFRQPLSWTVPGDAETFDIELEGSIDGVAVVPEPVCDIQLNKTSFVDGDQVIAQVLRVANPTATPLAIEFKFWFEVPGSAPISFARGGADGSVVLPAGLDQSFGPLTLFTVTAAFPRGAYAFNCRFLHPVTGGLQAEDLNPFTIP